MKNLFLRLILIVVIFFIYQYKIPADLYSTIAPLILLIGVIITYKEDRETNLYNSISNYVFWFIVAIMVLTIKKENELRAILSK